MLKAFIDDSGSGGDSEWYVLAGYLGTIQGWDSFDAQWMDILNRHPRIAYFKSSEAESLRSDSLFSPSYRDECPTPACASGGVMP